MASFVPTPFPTLNAVACLAANAAYFAPAPALTALTALLPADAIFAPYDTAPALTAKALPAGFLADLADGHLNAACRAGTPREGVLAAVGLLATSLDEAAGQGKGEGS